jgi:hypothetical protein
VVFDKCVRGDAKSHRLLQCELGVFVLGPQLDEVANIWGPRRRRVGL